MRRFVAPLSLGCILFALASVHADSSVRMSTAMLGRKIPNLSFQDEKGKATRLHDIKGKKAVVVVFLGFECPVANSYSQPLSDLARKYGKDVAFVGLTINQDQTPAQVAKEAREFKLAFPVFLDGRMQAAHAFQADYTPEAFVLDRDFVLRYRGRIDDTWYQRLKMNPALKREDLRIALDEVLAGKAVSVPATLAVGCEIVREKRPVPKGGEVVYHRDVVPILQQHCQQCHRPGEVGPFSLMNYKQAVNWSEDIRTFTQNRHMPPWKPSKGLDFHNERKLTEEEIDTLTAWVDAGCPEGDPKLAPPPRKWTDGWQLGTPDLVLTVEEDFTLGATGKDVFRCFVLPTHLKEDKYVTAVEIRPGNPRIVHHVLQFTDTTGAGRKLQEAAQKKRPAAKDAVDQGPGYSVAMGVGFRPTGGLGGWAPGQIGRWLPEGTGHFLPRGADVVVQVHYHRNGRVEKDRTQVGLYFARKPVDRPFQGGVVAGRGLLGPLFVIPAGAEDHVVKGKSYATGDFTLHTITPHMHMIGKKITLTMTPPGEHPRTLLAIHDWDYNWQETYTLKEPLAVKAGTTFEVEAVYDNSSNNPRNPFDPPRLITFGEQTDNEMCFVFLGGVSDNRRAGQLTRGLPLSRTPPRK